MQYTAEFKQYVPSFFDNKTHTGFTSAPKRFWELDLNTDDMSACFGGKALVWKIKVAEDGLNNRHNVSADVSLITSWFW